MRQTETMTRPRQKPFIIGIRPRYWTQTLSTCVIMLATSGCLSQSTVETPNAATRPPDEAQQRLVKRGRSQFLHCNTCHVVDSEAPPPFGDSLGPHLEDIVGRTAASVEGFAYTVELQAMDLTWDEQTLDKWLADPQALVPTMCEPFMGIAKPELRKALIAYLKYPQLR